MRYVRAETPEERKKYLAEHVRAIRDHVKELAAKDYQSVIKAQGLDIYSADVKGILKDAEEEIKRLF